MELIAQTAMEGTVGKLGRIMPRIKLHAAGRYSEDTLAGGEEDRQRELAKRRAGVRSTEQAVYDELCMESWNAEYEFLPCRKRTHNHQYTMREVHKLLDRAIHEGRVMAYEDYRTYWQRYMGYTMAWCFLKGRAKVLGSREAVAGLRHSAMRRTYGAELLAEYHRYYQRFPMRKPGRLSIPCVTRKHSGGARRIIVSGLGSRARRWSEREGWCERRGAPRARRSAVAPPPRSQDHNRGAPTLASP